jgi:hypothetical protein
VRRLSWVLALAVSFTACKKEWAPAPGEAKEQLAARLAGDQKPTEAAGPEASGPYTITDEKLEAYVGYQRRMLKVYETVQKDMQGLEARAFKEGAPEVARARLKLIETKAKAEEEARREARLTEDDINGIAEVVTAVIAQRQLARQMGFDEELQKLEALQAKLTPEQQQDLAPQVAEMRKRSQEFEGLAELRRAFGEANVERVLAREQQLTQGYQDMLKAFSGGGGASAKK